MSTIVSYPGVYIEEDASPALSISRSTATVPIIALFDIPSGPATRINNYLEYLSYFSGTQSSIYMRAYFEIGGGPCYVAYKGSVTEEASKYDDISLIVIGGQKNIESSINRICIPGSGLFALLDGPETEITDSTAADAFSENSCAAAYYPWIKTEWSDTHNIPPGFIMAALYCVTDRIRGVWKAPANIALPANYEPVHRVTDSLQAQYNSGKAINMIRKLDKRGAVVWGARTLEDSDDWRYVSVRRLFNSAERDIRKAMASMIFEPNNALTWEKVRTAISNYLHSLWRQGALAGTTEQQACFVKIGKDITMTDDDIAQGKMIVEVGMAAVRPAEFIILQFTQDVAPG